jgi:hypothetical protein
MRPARQISTDAGNFIKKILNWDTTIILALLGMPPKVLGTLYITYSNTSQGHILCINLGMPSKREIKYYWELYIYCVLSTTYSVLYLSVCGSRHTD